jgi:hypothetical protein
MIYKRLEKPDKKISESTHTYIKVAVQLPYIGGPAGPFL